MGRRTNGQHSLPELIRQDHLARARIADAGRSVHACSLLTRGFEPVPPDEVDKAMPCHLDEKALQMRDIRETPAGLTKTLDQVRPHGLHNIKGIKL